MSVDFGAAVQVHSIVEEYTYIAAHPCVCGGRWHVHMQALLKGARGRRYDRLDVVCPQCGEHRTFLFGLSSLDS